MSDQRDRPDSDTARLFTAAGITPTDAGLQAARRKLADMDARMTPERWAGLRRELELPAADAA
jgi:hypothetical protein